MLSAKSASNKVQTRWEAPVWPRCNCPLATHSAWTVESL